MARTALVLIACLAVFAGHASAKCNSTMTKQSATLKTQTPQGCLENSIVPAIGVPVEPSCLNDLVMNSTSGKGADCNTTEVSVAFAQNASVCVTEDPIAKATQRPGKAGASMVMGTFEAVSANFTGNVSADGKTMTMKVDNVTCTLTYTIKGIATEDVPEEEEEEANTTAAAGAAAAAPAEAPAPASAPKSAAAGVASLPVAVLAVIGTALAAVAL